ncbi:sensor protein ZraS [bacterium BMS3Abin04]|nr:sensor protein ZraS [bacterium BMS3Abin04]
MNIYSLPAVISFTINLSIALIILLDNPKAYINRWFSAFVFVFVAWNLSEVLILNSSNIESALFGAQILYRIIFLTPAFFVAIAYVFPKNFHSYSKRISFFLILFGIPVFFLILSFPNFQIKLLPLSNYSKIYYYRFIYNVDFRFFGLVLISLIYVVWGSIVLYTKIKRLKTIKQKNQAKFFLYGFLTILFLYLLINSFRSSFEPTLSFYSLSTLLTFLISTFFLFAILRYHFLNIKQIVKGGITYSLLSSAVLAVYFLIILGLGKTIAEFFNINSYFFGGVILIILVFLIRPLEIRLQNLIDRFLNRDIIEYRHNFFKFSRQIQNYLPGDVFFEKLQSFIEINFKLKNAFIYVYDTKAKEYRPTKNNKLDLSISQDDDFIKEIFSHGKAIEFYELKYSKSNSELNETFINNKINVVIPLIFENKLLAIIMLSEKKYQKEFTSDDLEALSIFSNEVALAYQRNLMIEGMKEKAKEEFELEKLAALGQLTAGVAHEIRNPLNTISMSAQTLLRKNLQKDQQKELIYYISDEVDRLERTLKDFLKLSKFRNPNIKTVDLDKLLDKVIINIESKGDCSIILKKQIDGNNIQIKTDSDLLFQVLLNLGLNAFEAIKERIKTNNNFNCEDGEIQFNIVRKSRGIIIKVIDNGIGMEDKNKNSVFNPFFTTKEEGTGLGLSIAHGIIESLKGKLEFNSKYGKTEFIIGLPQTAKKQERD